MKYFVLLATFLVGSQIGQVSFAQTEAVELGQVTTSSTESALLLYSAVLADDMDALKIALDAGADVNSPPEDARPLLHSAVIANSKESLKALIEAGANKTTVHAGETAYEFAVRIEQWAMASILADGTMQFEGTIALLDAISTDNKDRVVSLLDQGIDPNGTGKSSTTPLAEALFVGSESVVNILLNSGADPNLVTPEGLPPLYIAILADNQASVFALLAKGADPNIKVDGLPLLSIALLTNEVILAALLRAGARTDVRDDEGIKPADLAAMLGKDVLVEQLGGSNLGKAAPKSIQEAIATDDYYAVARALITGTSNKKDDAGQPYLFTFIANAKNDLAAREALLTIIEFDSSFFLNSTSSEGQNIMDAIVSNPEPPIRLLFITALSKFRRSNELERLLKANDFNGRSTINRLTIIDPKVSLKILTYLSPTQVRQLASVPDKAGSTPLEVAVLKGDFDLVRSFLKSGASTLGYAPSLQEIARARQDWDILKILPYDRTPPQGFKKGASLDTKKAMQKSLQDWGYYTGTIDGLLGAGSYAALEAYYNDVEEELRQMIKPEIDLSRDQVETDDSYFFLAHRPEGSWCWWKINYWPTEKGKNMSERFVGCVEANGRWNANGAALVVFSRSGPELKFLGKDGWDGDVDIR